MNNTGREENAKITRNKYEYNTRQYRKIKGNFS